jgi:hypothetical protein
MFFGNEHLTEILITVAFWVCILAACTGIALGIGLNISTERTLRFLKATNRWVSMKKSLEPLEKPRDIDKAIFKRRRTAGMVFILGGAYTVFMLLFVVEFPYVVYALSENANPIVVAILIEALKWFLIASGLLALFVGIMMLVSENALPNLRAKLDRWHSTDRITNAAGEMHMPLDSLTETYPRATGLVLLAMSVSALVVATIVWVIE